MPSWGRPATRYLHSVVPWIVALLGLATGLFLRAFGHAVSGKRRFTRTRTASFLTLWAACTFALVVIYAAQELIEGAVLVGHLPGLAGVFAFGGWWAVPAAGRRRAGARRLLLRRGCGAERGHPPH